MNNTQKPTFLVRVENYFSKTICIIEKMAPLIYNPKKPVIKKMRGYANDKE